MPGVPRAGAVNIDVGTLVGWFTIIGAIVSLGLWLRSETREIAKDANDRLIHGEEFELRVTKIVLAAMTGVAEPLTRAVADVEGRQREHGKRLGELERKVAGLEGRLLATRSADAP